MRGTIRLVDIGTSYTFRSLARGPEGEALVLGTGDYARKNGFTDVVIGLSGGIDSALSAAVAVDAVRLR